LKFEEKKRNTGIYTFEKTAATAIIAMMTNMIAPYKIHSLYSFESAVFIT